jgi:hypothetical protein
MGDDEQSERNVLHRNVSRPPRGQAPARGSEASAAKLRLPEVKHGLVPGADGT